LEQKRTKQVPLFFDERRAKQKAHCRIDKALWLLWRSKVARLRGVERNKKIIDMHPYIEILSSLFLAFLGMMMMRKLSSIKRKQISSVKKSYATEKYFKMLFNKISFRFMMVLFTLIIIIAITVLIEHGIMRVTW